MDKLQMQPLIKALIFFIGYGLLMALAGIIQPNISQNWQQGGWAYTSLLFVFLLTILAVKIDKSTLKDFDIYFNKSTFFKLLLGSLISIATFLMIPLSFALYFESFELKPIEGDRGYYIFVAVSTYLATASLEGLGNRGYTLKSLTKAYGATTSIIISAVVFALFHFLFGFSTYSIILGVLPMGLVLALAAHVTGGLAMPIGLHATWNILLWTFGNKNTPGIWFIDITEQQGSVQPFGTAINSILMLILILAFWYWGKRHKKF